MASCQLMDTGLFTILFRIQTMETNESVYNKILQPWPITWLLYTWSIYSASRTFSLPIRPSNHGSSGSTTSPAGGLDCPLQGHIAVPPKGGLTNHVHYVTGSRLKAASLLPLFKALFPVGHSRTAQQYTSLSFLHSHFRLFRSNNLLPRNDDHTDLCTPDVCQKASGYFSP